MRAHTGISSVFPKDVIRVAQNPSMPRGLCAGAIASVTLRRTSEVWKRLQTEVQRINKSSINRGCNNCIYCNPTSVPGREKNDDISIIHLKWNLNCHLDHEIGQKTYPILMIGSMATAVVLLLLKRPKSRRWNISCKRQIIGSWTFTKNERFEVFGPCKIYAKQLRRYPQATHAKLKICI